MHRMKQQEKMGEICLPSSLLSCLSLYNCAGVCVSVCPFQCVCPLACVGQMHLTWNTISLPCWSESVALSAQHKHMRNYVYFCKNYIYFLTVRLWTGLWTGLLTLGMLQKQTYSCLLYIFHNRLVCALIVKKQQVEKHRDTKKSAAKFV